MFYVRVNPGLEGHILLVFQVNTVTVNYLDLVLLKINYGGAPGSLLGSNIFFIG